MQDAAVNAAATMDSSADRDTLIQALSDLLPGGAPGSVPGRRQGAFLMAAIGNLSLINEAIGFHVGDEVIAIVGARLKGCLRERDCFARYGSNKYGIFLADCEPDQVDFVAGRIIRAVRESVIETSAGAVSISIRLGGILLPQQAKTVQDAFSGALDALDSARSRHGDSFVLFDDSTGRGARRKRNILIVDEVVRALNERRMVLALQPIVRAGSRKTAFYECLLRMQKPDGTYVSAGEFIPIAEKFGLARLIDHRVVELTIGLLRSAPNLSLSMNVSGETAGESDWLALLRGLVQGDQSLTRRLMVEITETAALTDIEECAGFVRALKETGCQVAIDDFGAGYSSFKNLRLLDVDMVKIDGSFVKDMAERSDDRFLVRTLVDLARNFSMSTVAEWVDDEATADLSEQAGVDFLQGFYFGMPQLAAPPAKKAPAQPAADGAQASAPIPAGAAESRPDSAPAL
jgi:diguanylate cyclase (GGDEF)-like protein